MRRAAFALALLPLFAPLTACPSEPPEAPRRPEPTASPALVIPATSTRTIAVDEAVSPPASPEPQPDPDPGASPDPAAAPGCPAWAGQARCTIGDRLYASASARGISNASLARTTAANRARAALLGGKAGTLNGAEVREAVSCGGALWALGSVPTAGLDLTGVAPCVFEAPAD